METELTSKQEDFLLECGREDFLFINEALEMSRRKEINEFHEDEALVGCL